MYVCVDECPTLSVDWQEIIGKMAAKVRLARYGKFIVVRCSQ